MRSTEIDNDKTTDLEPARFAIVMNSNREKALWPDRLRLPDGWLPVSDSYSEEECRALLRGYPSVDECALELLKHPSVTDAWVHPLCPNVVVTEMDLSQTGGGGVDPEQVLEGWGLVFDDLYSENLSDIVGWTDSITGQTISADELADWVDATIARIGDACQGAILEIGVGTGLVMQPLLAAGQVTRYVATDLSAAVIKRLSASTRASASAGAVPVEFMVGDARTIVDGVSGPFDLIVLNSICQYFPSTKYLLDLLRDLAPLVAPAGRIFLGDLRHAGLEGQLAEEQAFFLAPGDSLERIRDDARRLAWRNSELSLLPGWVDRLVTRVPGLTGVETGPRRGTRTEMSRFRFDALLQFGTLPRHDLPPARDGSKYRQSDIVDEMRNATTPFRLVGVTNDRLHPDKVGSNTESLMSAAEASGGRVSVRYADDGAEGALDIVYRPDSIGSAVVFSHPSLHSESRVAPALPPRAHQSLRKNLQLFLRERFETLDPSLNIIVSDETRAEWRG